MTTLISFLGKGKERGGNYRRASYRFEDRARATSFFGMALAECLKPARLILVGTSGSMWDVFFEGDSVEGDAALLDLIDAVPQNAVTEAMLAAQAGRLSKKLGYPAECLLIDQARDERGQIDLLARLAEKLSENEHIALDVTHSFRHLPMLALVAARFLTRIKKVVVEDIYYGALEMTENEETPVVRLKGLIALLDWVDALASFDKDGDYGVFSSLLEAEGMPHPQAQALQNAAFLERVNHIEGARQKLTSTFEAIKTHPGLFGRFFRQELENRLLWARSPKIGQRELALAKIWLDRRDYLRSTIFLLEGLVTQEVYRLKGNHQDFQERDAARKNLSNNSRSFKKLDRLRNALAHGQRSDDDSIKRLLGDEKQLRAALEQYIKTPAQ
jgi:CRISPR-associated Csx2 family protein